MIEPGYSLTKNERAYFQQAVTFNVKKNNFLNITRYMDLNLVTGTDFDIMLFITFNGKKNNFLKIPRYLDLNLVYGTDFDIMLFIMYVESQKVTL